MARIFLSYAREDETVVRDMHRRLSDAGFDVWMDKINLLPGQAWADEIRRTVRNSDFILLFFSKDSVVKQGFVQREFKLALDTLQDIPPGTIHTIPIRLDDCEIPEQFRDLQWSDLAEEGEFERIVQALNLGIEQRQRSTDANPPESSPEEPEAVIRRHIIAQFEVLQGSGVFLYGDLTEQVPDTFLPEDIIRVIEKMKREGLICFDGPFAPYSTAMRFPSQESTATDLPDVQSDEDAVGQIGITQDPGSDTTPSATFKKGSQEMESNPAPPDLPVTEKQRRPSCTVTISLMVAVVGAVAAVMVVPEVRQWLGLEKPTYALNVLTMPTDSAVKFLNSATVYTPGVQLEPGTYEVEVTREGYATGTKRIVVTDSNISVEIKLREMEYRLTVQATPSDSRIEFLDSNMTYRPGITLPPGTYRIKVSQDGYRSVERPIVVTDSDISVEIKLREMEYRLTVQATPSDSRIEFLDSNMTYRPGITLPPGTYRIKVSREGYQETIKIYHDYEWTCLSFHRFTTKAEAGLSCCDNSLRRNE